MRGLCVHINQPTHLQYATLWITTCVLPHAFAMEHEGGIDMSADQFYQKGRELMQHERAERDNRLVERERHATASQEEWEVERDI